MIFLYAALAFALLGGGLGIALAIAAKVFYTPTDPRLEQVRELLPGANCGGCALSGCDAMAAALLAGKKLPSACHACPAKDQAAICEILGIENKPAKRMRAQVMCCGSTDVTKKKYHYDGAGDCVSASKLGGGDKTCQNGCLGLGSCVSACPFSAISIQNGIASVDYKKCTGCGVCSFACPKYLISLIPYDSKTWVGCMSKEKGAITRQSCEVGCIGCKKCEKVCPVGAIRVEGSLARIDYTLCTDCGACAQVCPRRIICHVGEKVAPVIEKQEEVGV